MLSYNHKASIIIQTRSYKFLTTEKQLRFVKASTKSTHNIWIMSYNGQKIIEPVAYNNLKKKNLAKNRNITWIIGSVSSVSYPTPAIEIIHDLS